MEDEDDWNLSSPKTTSSSNNRAPETPVEETVVIFGHIGENKAKKHEGGWVEITRIVGDVDFRQSPLTNLVWSPLADHHFAMVWADNGIPNKFSSLESIADKYRRQGSLLSNSLLDEIDNKFLAYLAALEILEKSGWTQGLVTPDSVLFKETDGKVIAVFPDLGFRWTGDFGSPEWLKNHPGKEFFGNESPVSRQEAWNPSAGTNWKSLEVTIASKILAYCVGQSESSIKTNTKEHTVGEPNSPGFLGVLQKAIDGKYASASEFRNDVTNNLPSKSHTLLCSRLSPASPSGLARFLPFFLAIGLLVGVSILVVWKFFPPKPSEISIGENPSGKDTIPSSNLDSVATELTDAIKKGPNTEKDIDGVKTKRDNFNKIFIIELKKISDRYGSDQDRNSAIDSLKNLIKPMQNVLNVLKSTDKNNTFEEEMQCLNFAEAFLVQLSQ